MIMCGGTVIVIFVLMLGLSFLSLNTKAGLIFKELRRWQIAADANNGAMMVYALGTNTTPRYRLWNESADSWGSEGSATAVSGTIQFMVIKFWF